MRLHQFISGAGRAHATIEPVGVRKVVLDGQIFLPEGEGDKRLYALHFCHNCGQEHMPVWYCDDGGGSRLEARPIEDVPLEEDDESAEFGFFMPTPPEGMDFGGDPADYPETWTERARNGDIRLVPAYRKLRHERMHVRAERALSRSRATSRVGSSRANSGFARPAAKSPPRRVPTFIGLRACRRKAAVPQPPSLSPRS